MNDRSFVVNEGLPQDRGDPDRDLRLVFLGDHSEVAQGRRILIATARRGSFGWLAAGSGQGFCALKPSRAALDADAASFALSAVGFSGAVIGVHGCAVCRRDGGVLQLCVRAVVQGRW